MKKVQKERKKGSQNNFSMRNISMDRTYKVGFIPNNLVN